MLFALGAMAFGSSAALADGGVCPRLPAQSPVNNPPDIYSVNGVIDIQMNYYTSVDDAGRTLFCFVTSDGMETPTLHVNPGDTIKINLTDQVQGTPGGRSVAGVQERQQRRLRRQHHDRLLRQHACLPQHQHLADLPQRRGHPPADQFRRDVPIRPAHPQGRAAEDFTGIIRTSSGTSPSVGDGAGAARPA